jgi:hypothetical protein
MDRATAEYSLDECVWDWIEFALMQGRPKWRGINRHQPKREIVAVLTAHFAISTAEDFISLVRAMYIFGIYNFHKFVFVLDPFCLVASG